MKKELPTIIIHQSIDYGSTPAKPILRPRFM